MEQQKIKTEQKVRHISSIRDVIHAVETYECTTPDDVALAMKHIFKCGKEDAISALDSAIETEYVTQNETYELTERGSRYYSKIKNIIKERVEARESEAERVWPKNNLILIRGLPGAGKTVLGQTIVSGINAAAAKSEGQCSAIHLEIDQFLGDEIDANKVRTAARLCHALTEEALIDGYTVVVSNIFARYNDIVPFFELATLHCIRVQLLDAQGQWRSPSRPEKVKNTLAENWTNILLPQRWRVWHSTRRKAIHAASIKKDANNREVVQEDLEINGNF